MMPSHPTRWLMLLALLLGPAAFAQTTQISGTVTDADSGEPLPGVNIRVEATQIGTITNVDGSYQIALPINNRTLIYTFVGYRTQEVAVPEGQAVVDVQLEEDLLGLDEVVVTGLASSVKRQNLANSVETISARELAGVTTPSTLDGALQGKITGAVITSNSGAPGGGFSVRLRGVSTITGRAEPLYVVDGVIVNNDAVPNGINALTAASRGEAPSSQDNAVNRIADINPEDIESVEVLKGASAAAIYGSRASNGVVVISTKKGRAGAGTNVRFSQSIGATTIANRLGVRRFTIDEAISTFAGSPPDPSDPETTPEDIADYEAAVQNVRDSYTAPGGFIDYEDEIFGNTGVLSTTDLSISGGNERTQFFVSGQVKNDGAIVERTGYDKQSVRANLSHRFSNRASVDVTSNYVRSVTARGITGNDNSGTSLGIALLSTPSFVDIREDANGVFPVNDLVASSNPLQTIALLTNEETVNRVLSSGRFTYDVLRDERQALQAVVEAGVDYYGLESEVLAPRELQFEQARGGNSIGTSILGETSSLNTNYRGALVHSFNLPANRLFFTTQAGITGTNNNSNSISLLARGLVPGQQNVNQAASLTATRQLRIIEENQAFFGQTEANYADRVVATLGLRADRSNLNGDVEKFYFYPKASLAVNVAEFPFWSYDQIDQFKFRVAFGQTGNIAPFGAKFTSFNAVNIGGTVGSLVGATLGAADILPERTNEIEGGLDISALDGRANLEFTIYRKNVSDLLLTRALPPSTGFGVEFFNGGELVNQGLEVGLTVLPVDVDAVRWVSRTSFWTNSSEVTELNVEPFNAAGGGFASSLGVVRIEEGESPTQIVGTADRDGDGRTDGEFQLGDVAPDFQMSFSNDFTIFDNLTLNVFAHWKKGGDVINLTYFLYDLTGTSPDFGESSFEERTSTPGAERFVEDASYFRLRELGLYYNLPKSLLDRYTGAFGLRTFRIGASARNLFTITGYSGYDPEVSNFGSQPVASGVDVTPYPSARQYLFHVSVGL
ncbi:MAG: SusC/RagA family TonB-linked outer membrane protein [Rhodothermales bacterium]